MNPGNTFDFNRFRAYFAKFISENWRGLLLKACVLFGLMIIAALVITFNRLEYYNASHYSEYVQYRYYNDRGSEGLFYWLYFGMLGFGAFFASMAFGKLSNKENRLQTVTYPVSAFEQYLVRWIVYVPVFIIVYVSFAFLAEALRYGVCHSMAVSPELVRFFDIDSEAFVTINGERVLSSQIKFMAMVFIVIQSLFFLGGILWHRAAFVKTFLSGLIVALIYFFIMYYTVEWLTQFRGEPDFSVLGMSKIQFVYIVTAVVSIFCYALSFLRLKEMDVIDRW